jgi:hypothetical protein
LREIARQLEPTPDPRTGERPTGAPVRRRVESQLDDCVAAVARGAIPAWLVPAVAHLGTVLRRLGGGLYHCYDGPGLPRTDNDLEHF